MSEIKNAEMKKPKVTRVFVRDAAQVGVHTLMSISDKRTAMGDRGNFLLERTSGGVLVRHEVADDKGKKHPRTTFVPDANIASMDLEEAS